VEVNKTSLKKTSKPVTSTGAGAGKKGTKKGRDPSGLDAIRGQREKSAPKKKEVLGSKRPR